MVTLAIFCLFCAGLVFAATHDVLTMTIPNWLSIAYVVAFPPTALYLGFSVEFIGWSLLAGLIGLIVCIGLFSLNVFGGGDAKLLPAILVWMGSAASLQYVYGIALAGGLLAVAFIICRRAVPASSIPGMLQRSVVQGPGIPYAVAIAFGAIWALPQSPFLNEMLLKLM